MSKAKKAPLPPERLDLHLDVNEAVIALSTHCSLNDCPVANALRFAVKALGHGDGSHWKVTVNGIKFNYRGHRYFCEQGNIPPRALLTIMQNDAQEGQVLADEGIEPFEADITFARIGEVGRAWGNGLNKGGKMKPRTARRPGPRAPSKTRTIRVRGLPKRVEREMADALQGIR